MKSKISKLCEDTLKKSRTNRRLPRISVRSSRGRHRFVCFPFTTGFCVLQVCDLTLESMLTFTSSKSSDWFKRDVRQLGGLDYIINTGARHFLALP